MVFAREIVAGSDNNICTWSSVPPIASAFIWFSRAIPHVRPEALLHFWSYKILAVLCAKHIMDQVANVGVTHATSSFNRPSGTNVSCCCGIPTNELVGYSRPSLRDEASLSLSAFPPMNWWAIFNGSLCEQLYLSPLMCAHDRRAFRPYHHAELFYLVAASTNATIRNGPPLPPRDRKSTRLNSSHLGIS